MFRWLNTIILTPFTCTIIIAKIINKWEAINLLVLTIFKKLSNKISNLYFLVVFDLSILLLSLCMAAYHGNRVSGNLPVIYELSFL